MCVSVVPTYTHTHTHREMQEYGCSKIDDAHTKEEQLYVRVLSAESTSTVVPLTVKSRFHGHLVRAYDRVVRSMGVFQYMACTHYADMLTIILLFEPHRNEKEYEKNFRGLLRQQLKCRKKEKKSLSVETGLRYAVQA